MLVRNLKMFFLLYAHSRINVFGLHKVSIRSHISNITNITQVLSLKTKLRFLGQRIYKERFFLRFLELDTFSCTSF